MDNDRTIPGRVVAEVADAKLDDFRNWRREGFLDGFGERAPGGAWQFSRSETLMIALAVAMARAGLGFPVAFETVRNPTPHIIGALAGHRETTLSFSPRRQGGGGLSCTVKVVVAAGEIVSDAAKRLQFALEVERRRPRRQRLAFEPAPASSSHS